MFMGEYEHTIDDKGRLIIPAKFRSQLGDGFVVTRGLDGCLTGYPLSVWHELETKLKSLSMTKRNARAFVRFCMLPRPNASSISKDGSICQ